MPALQLHVALSLGHVQAREASARELRRLRHRRVQHEEVLSQGRTDAGHRQWFSAELRARISRMVPELPALLVKDSRRRRKTSRSARNVALHRSLIPCTTSSVHVIDGRNIKLNFSRHMEWMLSRIPLTIAPRRRQRCAQSKSSLLKSFRSFRLIFSFVSDSSPRAMISGSPLCSLPSISNLFNFLITLILIFFHCDTIEQNQKRLRYMNCR